MSNPAFDQAIQAHDQAIAELGLELWVGTEPTFTDRFSEAPEWLTAAMGENKAERAETLLNAMQMRLGGLVLRTIGRQYPGENLPRWSLGLYGWRDGTFLWRGPPDPALADSKASEPDLHALQAALHESLRTHGYVAQHLKGQDGSLRVVAHLPGQHSDLAITDTRLQRPALHDLSLPPQGFVDTLAEYGLWLFIIDTTDWRGQVVTRIELPACDSTERFREWLQALETATLKTGLGALLLTGFPPPVDASVWWTTITPDPAVIEINMAPYPDVDSQLAASRDLYAATAEFGLAPYRLYYNGTVADSGGGGHITLGGPSPEASPFFRIPQLLPRLLRYVNHHPALSYLWAHDYLGSSGQAVRTDERGRDAFHEFRLALALLEREPAPSRETLWSCLSQFLTDNCGNSHRAEINIEKLWNSCLSGRGMLGLVEFRALRMPHTPERTAALAALLRAVVGMLTTRSLEAPLRDWGEELHQRFALPYYLERDLDQVLDDLRAADLGLAQPLQQALLCEEFRHWVSVSHAGCELIVRRALEFWPLVGDVGRQNQDTSRLVDSSTMRLEFCLRSTVESASDFDGWQLAAQGMRLPLRSERDACGAAKVFGLRLHSFEPLLGLHPTLQAPGPLQLLLHHPDQQMALAITLFEWRPDNQAYPGLPPTLDDARERRLARCLATPVPAVSALELSAPPDEALTPYSFDLRWLPPTV